MGINEIAAVAVKKIGIAAGKKMRRKGIKADPLPKDAPTITTVTAKIIPPIIIDFFLFFFIFSSFTQI